MLPTSFVGSIAITLNVKFCLGKALGSVMLSLPTREPGIFLCSYVIFILSHSFDFQWIGLAPIFLDFPLSYI